MIKGTQKAEGLWRHLKHSSMAIPEEVHNDDERLDTYCQALVWRMQCCGCPYREVVRMCRAFRNLPLDRKAYVWNYGLKKKEGDKVIKRCLEKPPVVYCKWHLKGASGEESDGDDNGDAIA